MIPWLVSDVTAENEGLRYRFRLRSGIRFHDGRPLTARDVRHAFERLLQDDESDTRWPLSPIRGARQLIDHDATALEGFHIVSPTEFYIDLVKPVPFFPALMSEPAAAIVPEGTRRVSGTWRDQCVGTGPFRVVSFEPGRRLLPVGAADRSRDEATIGTAPRRAALAQSALARGCGRRGEQRRPGRLSLSHRDGSHWQHLDAGRYSRMRWACDIGGGP